MKLLAADPGPSTIGAALAAGAARLAAAGIESPRREARLLLALATGLDQAAVLGYPERVLAAAAERRFGGFIGRRATHEPVSRLAGRREFWGLDFALSPETLDPRPDSETLVAAALARLPDRNAAWRIVDFGTGSGCLLLALLSALPRAIGFGFDLLPGAAKAARCNALALGLDSRAFFAVGWWDAAISGRVDVILANPPYIPTGSIPDLPPAVACFDPPIALDGGSDGLAAYRSLAPAVARLLTPGGSAFLELGQGQAAAVSVLCRAAGLRIAERHRDLGGIERCLVLTRESGAEDGRDS